MSDEIYTRTCPVCSAEYSKGINVSKRMWSERYKACSKTCAAKQRDSYWLESHKMKAGSTLGEATRFKKGQTEGELNSKWKGDSASYAAKHMWASSHFGRPMECEHCGTTEKRMYHWSNISGEYLRERDDWQRLCVPCHKQYDLARLVTN